jgi:hypothetical protein
MTMKYVLTALAVGLLAVAFSAFGARADEGDDAAAPCRACTEHAVERQLFAAHADAQEKLARKLFALLEEYSGALDAARELGTARERLLHRRIDHLHEALEAERKRTGPPENELLQELAASQERHTHDVMLLQRELAAANEIAEANRLEATRVLQRITVAEMENDRLRQLLVRGVRTVGEMGPAARAALPWLEAIEAGDDAALKEAVAAAKAGIGSR